jgi:hypothetical protein
MKINCKSKDGSTVGQIVLRDEIEWIVVFVNGIPSEYNTLMEIVHQIQKKLNKAVTIKFCQNLTTTNP